MKEALEALAEIVRVGPYNFDPHGDGDDSCRYCFAAQPNHDEGCAWQQLAAVVALLDDYERLERKLQRCQEGPRG